MAKPASQPAELDKGGLDGLIAALARRGYRVIGPTVADDAVVYGDVASVADLPAGLGDEQAPGRYRLRPRGDGALFGYTVAPQGWKRFLHPPRQKIFSAARTPAGWQADPPEAPAAPLAFLGVRACELAAIAVQTRVFGDPQFPDPGYNARRDGAFIVAAECGEAGAQCFCSSMGGGPAVNAGFDIRLVELAGKDRHVFIATAGSERGAEVLAELNAAPAGEADVKAAAGNAARAEQSMSRTMPASARNLAAHPDHARWDEVAKRCLSCGNCTMVCPTCFCTTVEDVTDLKGDHAERWRRWDSCFTVDFSYIHGGAVRTAAASRYRQWITHKLSTWYDQFGTSGCVGCGRCITWCPVGIDITEEVRAIDAGQ